MELFFVSNKRWILLFFWLAGTANSSRASADCTLSPRASNLVSMLDRATLEMLDSNGKADPAPKGGRHPDWPPHCSQFLRAFMRELAKSGGFSVEHQFTDETANADTLSGRISQSNGWSKVDTKDVQTLANRGIVVVGSVPGHVGVVFPVPPTLDVSAFAGHGPFVRDGNEHPVNHDLSKRLFPSSYGAVRASEAFGPVDQIHWFQFNQTIPSTYEAVRDRMNSWLAHDQSCKEIESQQTGILPHWTGTGVPAGVWVYFNVPLPHSSCPEAISCASVIKSDEVCELAPGQYTVQLVYSETDPDVGMGHYERPTQISRAVTVKPGKISRLNIP